MIFFEFQNWVFRTQFERLENKGDRKTVENFEAENSYKSNNNNNGTGVNMVFPFQKGKKESMTAKLWGVPSQSW